MKSRLISLSLAVVVLGACRRPPPPDTGPTGARDDAPPAATAAEPGRSGPDEPLTEEAALELEELREIGPTYVPFDREPEIIWDTEADAVLSRKLLPVLREQDLPASTRAIYWLLVGPDGAAAEARVQTGSGNSSFDEAGAEVALALRYRPAVRGERRVAVWILQEISLLMQ